MDTEPKTKQSVYLPEEELLEIQHEAIRLDRSASWIMQKSWELARTEIRQLPAAPRLT